MNCCCLKSLTAIRLQGSATNPPLIRPSVLTLVCCIVLAFALPLPDLAVVAAAAVDVAVVLVVSVVVGGAIVHRDANKRTIAVTTYRQDLVSLQLGADQRI